MQAPLLGESQNARDARIEKLWATLDTKKQGCLGLAELKEGLSKLDHPLKNADVMLKDILKVVDTSGDGKIQYEEFRDFVEATEAELWQLFKTIDKDGNGKLDKGELRQAFKTAGLEVPDYKLSQFFVEVDRNKDGTITFDEWRDFLLFIPHNTPNLKSVLTFYSSAMSVNSEGDIHLREDTVNGMGYFLSGAIAGAVSRTATAPFDRLKVYLIADMGQDGKALDAVKSAKPVEAVKSAATPLVEAIRTLWRTGGIKTFFAGNGLNVLKVMPESAIKFGSFEASKGLMAQLEGHNDKANIASVSKFLAGGVAGVLSQLAVYPIDTLKFRMQCEIVEGGSHGNQLIAETAKKMWRDSGSRAFYRGLSLGLLGIFPMAALDFGSFEYMKRALAVYYSNRDNCGIEQVELGNFTTAAMGATSGAIGATCVYPINVLRTRLQTQGSVLHPQTYDGIADVTRKTIKKEGYRALFKGLTPNLLKVVPAVSISYVAYENSKKLLGLH